MTYVITQNCCNDAACVPACPVNCIHPTPDEPDYATAEMLYIDPSTCIDCGACLDVCPVAAISPDYDLPEQFLRYKDVNAQYYEDPKHADYDAAPRRTIARPYAARGPLKVAVVGSGPAACYAAEELLSKRDLDVRVDMFERLPAPGGLVRYGVAPDHKDTKAAGDAFARTLRRENLRLFLNTSVGQDISHAQLMDRYNAVIYAVGAGNDRALEIPGEDLPGSHSATEFVSWYNGHPDFSERTFDLSGERAVIIGNGNVALDVARVLVSSVERLRETDIAEHALDQLAQSLVREVVLVGRRGVQQAAYTRPEFMGLAAVPDVDLVYVEHELTGTPLDLQGSHSTTGLSKRALMDELATTSPLQRRRVTFRFLASPTAIRGVEHVEGVRLVRNELYDEGGQLRARPTSHVEDLPCGLLFRAVGYQGTALPGLPFDHARAVLPNSHGRVLEDHSRGPLRGVYAAGWIKRGPSGFIGSNKRCAQETTGALLKDYEAELLNVPSVPDDDLAELLPAHLNLLDWRLIDAHEKAAGRPSSRPRIKLVNVHDMLSVARGTA